MKKRLSKLHRDAAMLCSACATRCADGNLTNWLSIDEMIAVLGVGWAAASWFANRALEACRDEFFSMQGDEGYGTPAIHWALAASVLLNGEVT